MTMADTAYPPYVSTLGYAEQCSPAPGLILGAMCYAFAYKVTDTARLQATVDHFLNEPPGGKVTYKLLGELVFNTFLHAEKLTSGAEAIGWQPDYEAAFWVPLHASGPEPGDDRLVFWMPYVALSVSEGMVTGREIWGFPKQVGEVDVATVDGATMRFESRAMVYDPLATETQGRVEPLVTVTGPAKAGGLVADWDSITGAMSGMHDLWTGGDDGFRLGSGFFLNTLDEVIHGEVALVNLKQFRDAWDSTKACYQALIEGPCKVQSLRGGGLLPEGFSATIPDWASHRIAYHLGLPMEEAIPAVFGTWVAMDFAAMPGREVWKNHGGSEPPPPASGCLNLPALLRKLFGGGR
jgi:hypothetical protein